MSYLWWSRNRSGDPSWRWVQIIRDNPDIYPRRFAELMWPNSEGWNRYTKAGGYGVARGGAMPRAGGCFLAKLARDGLVWLDSKASRGYQTNARISSEGRRALEAA